MAQENEISSVPNYEDGELVLSSRELTEIPQNIILSPNVSGLCEMYLDYNDISEIPAALCEKCINLETLSLIGNKISQIPNNIHQMENLRQLYLNENLLDCLSDSLCKLYNLMELNVVGNKISQLSQNIGDLKKLEELLMDENFLEAIPDSFCNLRNLQTFEVVKNNINHLPDKFGHLCSLRVLNLASNNLKQLPCSFGELNRIEDLDISHNFLNELPSVFKSESSLERIFLEGNDLTSLPDWINHLPQLRQLNAQDNKLQGTANITHQFPATSIQLKKIELAGNFITTLPENFGLLKNIEKLHFGSTIKEIDRMDFINGNWISAIPDSFSQLVELKTARLDENQIASLPDDFGRLVKLTKLDVGQNLISVLPDSFCDLISLEECTLSKNRLTCLPENFGQLKNLKLLNLDHNILTSLPESLGELSGLHTLDLFHNGLTHMPECLKKLTSTLKLLDLDKNKFDMHYLDYPQIAPGATYPPRDPALKDNWRGKRREDQLVLPSTKIEAFEEREEYTGEEPPDTFHYHLLRSAMFHNMSLWRTHGSTETRRQTYVQDGGSKWVRAAPPGGGDGNRVISIAAEALSAKQHDQLSHVDEIWEPPIDETYLRTAATCTDDAYLADIHAADVFAASCTENWDTDDNEEPTNPPTETVVNVSCKGDSTDKMAAQVKTKPVSEWGQRDQEISNKDQFGNVPYSVGYDWNELCFYTPSTPKFQFQASVFHSKAFVFVKADLSVEDGQFDD